MGFDTIEINLVYHKKQYFLENFQLLYCQAQPKPQLKLSWAEFSFILTKIHNIACATQTT